MCNLILTGASVPAFHSGWVAVGRLSQSKLPAHAWPYDLVSLHLSGPKKVVVPLRNLPFEVPEAQIVLHLADCYGVHRISSDMTLSALDAGPLLATDSGAVAGPGRARRVCRGPHLARLATLRIPLLISLLLFLQPSWAQLDPVANFCRRFGQQTAVIDRKVYIDGGFINYNPLTQYPTNYSSEFSTQGRPAHLDSHSE